MFSRRVENDYFKVRAYLQGYCLNWLPVFTSPYLSPLQKLPWVGEGEVRMGERGTMSRGQRRKHPVIFSLRATILHCQSSTKGASEEERVPLIANPVSQYSIY